MRKLITFIAVLFVALSALVASPATAATKHHIVALNDTKQAIAWAELDKRPATVNKWLEQGSMLSLVGHSKTATATYPMRSIPAKRGGYYVFAVAPAGRSMKVTAKQYKNLKNVLPTCKYEDSLNCVWEGKKRGNKRGNNIVNFQHSIVIQKR